MHQEHDLTCARAQLTASSPHDDDGIFKPLPRRACAHGHDARGCASCRDAHAAVTEDRLAAHDAERDGDDNEARKLRAAADRAWRDHVIRARQAVRDAKARASAPPRTAQRARVARRAAARASAKKAAGDPDGGEPPGRREQIQVEVLLALPGGADVALIVTTWTDRVEADIALTAQVFGGAVLQTKTLWLGGRAVAGGVS